VSKRAKQATPTYATPHERLREAFNQLLAWAMTVDTELMYWHVQCASVVLEIQSAKRAVDDANARRQRQCDTADS
jgi:hypothetical protein